MIACMGRIKANIHRWHHWYQWGWKLTLWRAARFILAAATSKHFSV